MVASLLRLRRDSRGHTVTELALLLPAFLAVMLLILEVGWQFAVRAALDQGIRQGSRWVSLGAAAPAGQTREQYLAQLIVSVSGMPLDAARLGVSASTFASFSQINVAGAGTAGLGGPNDVVKYTVTYRSTFLTPFAANLLPSSWLDFSAVLVEQNEPYPIR